MEEPEVVGVAYCCDVSEEAAGEAPGLGQEIALGEGGGRWVAAEETALEGQEGQDCGC